MELDDRPRRKALLDRFALMEDDREAWRVAHPLPEVLLLLVCGAIAACDDFEEIVEWGEDNLEFLRRFSPFFHGLPSARRLRVLVNRMNGELFSEIFASWAAALRPEAPALVALDGKTSRGGLDRGGGRAALRLVSAFATRERLVIGQEAVAQGGGEQETILALLERLAAKRRLEGSLVTIDAVACNAKTAQAILDAGADHRLAVKANQPGLMREIESFFLGAPARQLQLSTALDKGHGRVEERRVLDSTEVDWLDGQRRFPANIASPASPPSRRRKPSSSKRGAKAVRSAFMSRQKPSTLRRSAKPSAPTGGSRTPFAGGSTSPSRRTPPRREPPTAPETWPSSATSP